MPYHLTNVRNEYKKGGITCDTALTNYLIWIMFRLWSQSVCAQSS